MGTQAVYNTKSAE